MLRKSQETFANSTTAGYMEAMYTAWLKDPGSVHISWQAYFSNLKSGMKTPFQAPPTLIPTMSIEGTTDVQDVDSSHLPSGEILDTMKVQLMVRAFQIRGHHQAKLDPLGISFVGKTDAPELTPQHYGFTESDLDRKFYLGGSIGIEYGHIPVREQCDWLRSKFEIPSKYKYTKEQKISILDRLMWSDHFEKFVSTKFPSEKRFGLEGCETLIPGMKALVDTCVEQGANSVVVGMPHRGRLNVLANVVRKPHASIFSEFSGTQDSNVEGSGDVKYHLGMNYARPTPSGKIVHLSLAANPSHLEAVDPVVLGKVRGLQFFQKDEE
ncbi:2-oxoglutarate dehydrogenase E1 component, partial [Kappamyces sp. JEL0680]